MAKTNLNITFNADHFDGLLAYVEAFILEATKASPPRKPADPNAAMLARDGQPRPTPTPAAPYLVQAPRSGDGLLTVWNPDARGAL